MFLFLLPFLFIFFLFRLHSLGLLTFVFPAAPCTSSDILMSLFSHPTQLLYFFFQAIFVFIWLFSTPESCYIPFFLNILIPFYSAILWIPHCINLALFFCVYLSISLSFASTHTFSAVNLLFYLIYLSFFYVFVLHFFFPITFLYPFYFFSYWLFIEAYMLSCSRFTLTFFPSLSSIASLPNYIIIAVTLLRFGPKQEKKLFKKSRVSNLVVDFTNGTSYAKY